MFFLFSNLPFSFALFFLQRISLHAKEYLENTIFGDSTQSLSTSEKPEIDTLIVEESSESESSVRTSVML